jgi:cellobiose phosphorylase
MPCLPADWEGFKMHYRYRETVYHVDVRQTPAGNGEMHVSVDGIEQYDKAIPLVDDHKEHWVEVRISVDCGIQRSDGDSTGRELQPPTRTSVSKSL